MARESSAAAPRRRTPVGTPESGCGRPVRRLPALPHRDDATQRVLAVRAGGDRPELPEVSAPADARVPRLRAAWGEADRGAARRPLRHHDQARDPLEARGREAREVEPGLDPGSALVGPPP